MLFVRLTKTFQVTGFDAVEDLDRHTDRVMDELLKLESATITDADLSAMLSTGIVELSITVAAGDFDEAVECADSCIRAAIHSAGGHTPGWEPIASWSKRTGSNFSTELAHA